MEIKIGDLTLTGNHPNGYDQLNNGYVCLEIGGEKVSVEIETLISALRTMRLRG